ncbi:MAG: NF038122 family metalloprotease [Synechococcales bacterium]|nr:NF038122 family metalloprotease [Synechococcales bacterium]
MVNFNFKFDNSYTAGLSGTALTQANTFMTQLKTGMELAGRVWSSYLTDNVTVNIGVGVMRNSTLTQEQRNKKVIGGALPAMMYTTDFNWTNLDFEPMQTRYSSFRNALRGDAKSADDRRVAGNPLNPDSNPGLLRTGDWYEAWFDQFDENFNNIGQFYSGDKVLMTRANGKALGLLQPTDRGYDGLDGYILLSDLSGYSALINGTRQQITWANSNTDFSGSFSNVSSAPTGTRLDMLSVIMHEMGHILGYVSGVDQGWSYSTIDTTLNGHFDYLASVHERIDYTSPLDFFRMSDHSIAWSTDDYYVHDMSAGGFGDPKYFTVDKGVTRLAEYASGTFSDGSDSGGDGQQASHWRNSTTNIGGINYRVGLMGPSLRLGSKPWIGHLDLRALDVIGWDLSTLASGVISSTNTGVKMGRSSSVTNLSTLLSQAQAATINTGLTSTEIKNMIRGSYIYNDGSGNDPFWNDGSGNDPFWNDGSGNDPFWQRITNLFWSSGAFQELDLSDLGSQGETPIAKQGRAVSEMTLSDVSAPVATNKLGNVGYKPVRITKGLAWQDALAKASKGLTEILDHQSFWKGNVDLKSAQTAIFNSKRLSEVMVDAITAGSRQGNMTNWESRLYRFTHKESFTSDNKPAQNKPKWTFLDEGVALNIKQLEIKL